MEINNKNIHIVLINLNITPDLKGYECIKYALLHPEFKGMHVYEECAKHLNYHYNTVDREIRTCLKKIPAKHLKIIVGNSKPTNLAVITCLRFAMEYDLLNEILSEEA